jgi:hypothetical protein
LSLGLFKVLKRRASVDAPESVDAILETEFVDASGQPDFEVSTYEMEDAANTLSRGYAEHHAASGLDSPFRTKPLVDLSGLNVGTVVVEPGAPQFVFTRDAHRTIRLQGVADQRRLIEAMMGTITSRRRFVEKTAAESYVGERLVAYDEEWLKFGMGSNDQWRTYLNKVLDKHRKSAAGA